jgi:hypothetical protein
MVLCFPVEDNHDVVPFFGVPTEGARRREHADRVPYPQWIEQIHIEVSPGEGIDYDQIRTFINELNK